MNIKERQKASKKYLKEAKKCKDGKVDALFKKYQRKLQDTFPEWCVAYKFPIVLLHKHCTIAIEKHYIAIIRNFNFEIDMRDNWKKQIKSQFKAVAEYLARSK